MGAGTGSPRGAHIIPHGAEKLYIKQYSVPDREIALPIQEGTQHTHPSSSFLPDIFDERRPVESCIESHRQVTSCVDPLDRFTEKRYWSGLDEALSGPRENYSGALRDINGNSPFTQSLKVVYVNLEVAKKQRRLWGSGYDGRVVRVEGKLDVVQG